MEEVALQRDEAMVVVRSPRSEKNRPLKSSGDGNGEETAEIVANVLEELEQVTAEGAQNTHADQGVVTQSRGILFNFRDLANASTDYACQMKEGKIFRSACLTRGNTSEEDVKRALAFLTEQMSIKTIIDLRAKGEKKEDKLDKFVEEMFPTINDKKITSDAKRKRFSINFIGRNFSLNGLFWQSTKSTKIKMALSMFNKTEMTITMARDVLNDIGLAGMNKMMLLYSHEEIVRALRIISNEINHPLMFHCASGKDRTGLLTMLVLACCGVSEEDIIYNYAVSERYLSEVFHFIKQENEEKGLDEGFHGTPDQVMQETLEFIKDKWGSVGDYLVSVGFSYEEQSQLSATLLRLEGPDSQREVGEEKNTEKQL